MSKQAAMAAGALLVLVCIALALMGKIPLLPQWLTLSLGQSAQSQSAAVVNWTSAGSSSWIAPSGVTSVAVKVVGGGASGGPYGPSGAPRGGGSGGVNTNSGQPYAVVPGTTYTIAVGAGGPLSIGNGQSSTFGVGSASPVTATGGTQNVGGSPGGSQGCATASFTGYYCGGNNNTGYGSGGGAGSFGYYEAGQSGYVEITYTGTFASIYTTPASIPSGTTTLVVWNTANYGSCTVSGPGISTVSGLSGSVRTGVLTTGASPTTHTYTLACPAGTTVAQATATVLPTPSLTLSANPTTLQYGSGTSVLTWSASNTNYCTLSAGETTGGIVAATSTASLYQKASAGTLTRTLAAPTAQNVYTFSAWMRNLGSFGAPSYLFGAGTTGSLQHALGFNSTGALVLILAGSTVATSPGYYRDSTRWYHVVYTQNGSTGTLYVDGVQVATGSGTNTRFNTAVAHQLGGQNGTSNFTGIFHDIYFVDGQALAPGNFGESSSGYWRPKAWTPSGGGYGNNGFHLDFAGGSTMGSDISGKFNNWSFSGGAGSLDRTLDTPFNEFYPLMLSSGRWYWEVTALASGVSATLGGSYSVSVPSGLTYGFRYDADFGMYEYTTNGSTWNSLSITATSPLAPSVTGNAVLNLGQGGGVSGLIYNSGAGGLYKYTVPAAYKAVSTQNLPVPLDPKQFFDVKAYSGTGGTQSISGLSFTPDLVWIKNLGTTNWFLLADSLRMATKSLFTNEVSAQSTNDQNGFLSAFTSGGFTAQAGSSSAGNTNALGNSYISWLWKKGATPGFDIKQWTAGVAPSSVTIAHGLGTRPDLIIARRTDAPEDWLVWTSAWSTPQIPFNFNYFKLNATDNTLDYDIAFATTSITASQIGVTSGLNGGTGDILLMHFDSGTMQYGDSSLYARGVLNLTAPIPPAIDTAQKKFGSGSFIAGFPYSGGYRSNMLVATSTREMTPHGDFTIDFWMSRNGGNNNFDILYKTGTWVVKYTALSNSVSFQATQSDGAVATVALGSSALNQWVHYAVVRSGTTLSGYKDGALQGTASITKPLKETSAFLTIGTNCSCFMGLLDEVRISDGVARFTSAFTPPTAPYTPTFSPGSYIAYLFSARQNFSAFGFYQNGEGLVYTGFRPRLVLIKKFAGVYNGGFPWYQSAGGPWVLYDTVRNSYSSGNEKILLGESSNTEVNIGFAVDVRNDGFSIVPGAAGDPYVNVSGNYYWYGAFAEMPFKHVAAPTATMPNVVSNVLTSYSNQTATVGPITATTIYTLMCRTPAGVATTTTMVTLPLCSVVAQGSAPSSCPSQCVFASDKLGAGGGAGQAATLSWCCPAPGPSTGTGPGFSTGGSLTDSAPVTSGGTFTLGCPGPQGGYGSLTLAQLQPPPVITTALTVTNAAGTPITPTPVTVAPGSTVYLKWGVSGLTAGATPDSCNITPTLPTNSAWPGVASTWAQTGTAQQTQAINSNTTFTLSCSSVNGAVAPSSATVNVSSPQILSPLRMYSTGGAGSASIIRVRKGSTVPLTWNVTGLSASDDCSISTVPSGMFSDTWDKAGTAWSHGASPKLTNPINTPTIITLSCTSSGGSVAPSRLDVRLTPAFEEI